MKKITKLFIGLMCSACLFLSGCNTVKGFGKDVSQGGQEIEQAANKASSSL